MSASAPSQTRARLLTLLKIVLAGVILVLVVRRVPWNDELSFQDATTRASFEGEIVGDWKLDRVRFTFVEPQSADGLPTPWRANASGVVASVEVVRDEHTAWQPGMPSVFREVDPRGLSFALALASIGIVATALRWWRLLGAAGCPSRFFPALRLTFIGFFFNIVVPGLTGGDLVKAVMIARSNPERRAAAAMSVLVDRLIGVFVLVAMGAVAILAQGDRFPYPRTPIFVGLAVAVLGTFAYLSPAVRRAIGFERWIGKLPLSGLLRKIDDAITVYSKHPREFGLALVFSFANQCCVMAALVVLGRSLGDTTLSVANYVVVGAIGNLASAVPLTPGGVGVTEVIYGELFRSQGGSWTLGLATSFAWRLCMITVGLCGGLFLLAPGGRMTAAERAELESRTQP